MNRTRFLAIVRVISRSYVVNSLPDTCRLYIINLAHMPDKQLKQFICVRFRKETFMFLPSLNVLLWLIPVYMIGVALNNKYVLEHSHRIYFVLEFRRKYSRTRPKQITCLAWRARLSKKQRDRPGIMK